MPQIRLTTWLLLAAVSFPIAGQTPKIEGPMPAKDGETCVICNTRLTTDDKAFLVDGQRICVMSAMEAMFLEDPMTYVAKYRPEGMMFSAQAQSSTLPDLYLFLGIYVLLGLVFGGLCAHVAVQKGLRPWTWFFAGFLLSAVGYVMLLAKPAAAPPGSVPAGLKKVPLTREVAACPACGASNHPSAVTCSGCGATLAPTAPSEVAAVRHQSN